MTLQKAKSIARHLGLTLREVCSGDYRVNFRDGNETTAYYTDNLEDAVISAVEMARKRALVSCSRTRSCSSRDDCRLCHTVLAATNKSLARINKSLDGGKATKKQAPQLEGPVVPYFGMRSPAQLTQ
jgi:hypothetical protein